MMIMRKINIERERKRERDIERTRKNIIL